MHGLSQIIKSVILSVLSVESVVNQFMEINIISIFIRNGLIAADRAE